MGQEMRSYKRRQTNRIHIHTRDMDVDTVGKTYKLSVTVKAGQ
jgi:hypothetical protein